MSFYMELGKAALKIVKDVLDVRLGENVLIFDDSASDPRVREALAAAAFAVGGRVTVCTYETPPEVLCEPPTPVAEAMKAADVLIENSSKYIIYSKTATEALKSDHVRVYHVLGGYNAEEFDRLVGKLDYPRLIELQELLCDMTEKAKKVRVTSRAGTDIVGFNDGRLVPMDCGAYVQERPEIKMIFPPGQIGWCPIEETINGTMVFDGMLWPPDDIGALPSPPVKVKVEKGVIVGIEGSYTGDVFKKWLDSFNDERMYRIAHFTYGVHPTAQLKPTMKIAEGERIFGCFELGMGAQQPGLGKGWEAPAHCDGTILAPSIYLDNEQIEDNGRFIHPELKRLAKKMGIKGY